MGIFELGTIEEKIGTPAIKRVIYDGAVPLTFINGGDAVHAYLRVPFVLSLDCNTIGLEHRSIGAAPWSNYDYMGLSIQRGPYLMEQVATWPPNDADPQSGSPKHYAYLPVPDAANGGVRITCEPTQLNDDTMIGGPQDGLLRSSLWTPDTRAGATDLVAYFGRSMWANSGDPGTRLDPPVWQVTLYEMGGSWTAPGGGGPVDPTGPPAEPCPPRPPWPYPDLELKATPGNVGTVRRGQP